MGENAIVFDHIASDEMFLNDAFNDRWGASGIPDSLGIHHGNRAIHTNAQTVCFGAKDTTLFTESQFFKAGFKVVPCLEAQLFVTAFWLGLITAEQDVATGDINAQGRRGLAQNGFVS